ncbi:hypothetical protein [Mesorhizobium sp. M4B.F.Ca.ET.058.02.1.1]|uniref:hypothetical protein n=1 Tax=unclassified Mesorhizobium TaxID=325217 RepID=UPI0032AFDF2A
MKSCSEAAPELGDLSWGIPQRNRSAISALFTAIESYRIIILDAAMLGGIAMVRRKKPRQLSGSDLELFLQAAEALHKSIVGPLISPQCDHYRSLQLLHEALLKTCERSPARKWRSSGGTGRGR